MVLLGGGEVAMYTFIRFFLWIILSAVIVFLVWKKGWVRNKKQNAVLVIGLAVLYGLVAVVPYENAFVTFDSVEDAFAWGNTRNEEIFLIIPGESADLIISGKDKNSKRWTAIPKTKDGWRTGTGGLWPVHTKTSMEEELKNGVAIYVYRYRNTEDCFLSVTLYPSRGFTETIRDNRGSEFILMHESELSEQVFYTYYAHFIGLDEPYILTVDDTEFLLIAD